MKFRIPSSRIGLFLLVLLFCTRRECRSQYPEVTYREGEGQGRRYLFGDWNGKRTNLENRGIVFDLENSNDNMWVLHGGASNQGTAWERIRGTFDIDFGKLSDVKGLRFHATALWQTGDNIAGKLGSYANPSGLGSVHIFRMDSYWIEDTFARDRLTVRLGQMAGWDFYANQEYGADFMIEPLGYAFENMFANTDLTYSPAGVPAAQLLFDGAKKTENGSQGFYAQSGIFSGNRNPYVQNPTGLEFKIRNSPVVAAEAGYLVDATTSSKRRLPHRRKLYPGIYRVGTAYNPGRFTNQLTGSTSKGNYLLYVLFAQAVYRAEQGTSRGLDLTFGFDTSPGDVSQQSSVITAAAKYHGPLRSRRNDDFSLGFVSTGTGSALSEYSQLLSGVPLGRENAYTIDYRAQIRRWFVVQMSAQYFTSISGNPNRSSGLVVGFRTYLRL